MENQKRFKELMVRAAEVFQRDLTTTLLDAYWDVMNYYSDAKIEVAFAKGMRECRFFPKPVDLIEFINASQEYTFISSEDYLRMEKEKLAQQIKESNENHSIKGNGDDS